MEAKKKMILSYLQSGKKLTPDIAKRKFGCMSLSQRVGELKKAGHPIRSKMIQVAPRTRVSRYSLNPDDYTLTFQEFLENCC